MLVCDSARRPIALGREIGKGGEATVYRVTAQGYAGQLAKIYTSSPPPDQEKKLAWMVANPPHDPTRAAGHASIAWPLGLLHDERRQFVGYLMPYIQDAVPLLQVFNPLLRKRTLPDFNWRYLHRTARNLAAALGALHARDYVMGDLHESNFLVTPQTMVTLIDTDSFQVIARHGAKPVIYRCPVGKIEYTPPELQGRSFRDTPRRPEHDSFGLAVLVFQLLMEGSHPFRAQWLGSGEPLQLEEKIRRGCFPYVEAPVCPVAPPRRARPLETLHPRVVELVRGCFVDGHQNPRWRPTPQDWLEALIEAEDALVTCRAGHYYSGHLRACPDCGGRAKGTVSGVPRPALLRRRGQGWLSWQLKGLAARAIGRRPHDALDGAVAGATVWATGGAIFGAVSGALAGALGQALDGPALWAVMWTALWAIGWWAFAEVLGGTVGRRGQEKVLGIVGAASGAVVGGSLGWAIGERGAEGLRRWLVVSALDNLIGLEGLLGDAFASAVGGTLVWAGVWAVVGAVGGGLGWRTLSRRELIDGLRRVPGKVWRTLRTATGAVEGGIAGAIVGVMTGPVAGAVVGGLDAAIDTALVTAFAPAAGGALLGATVATIGRVYIPYLNERLGRALETIGASVGLVVGLVIAHRGSLLAASVRSGLAGVAQAALVGLTGGVLVGLVSGTLAGALTGAIARARQV